MFLGQGFQHLFVALSAADLLSAPTIKSRFVSIDSGHSYSPACKRCTNESSNCCKASLVAGAEQKELTPRNFQVNTALAFQGNFSIAKAQRAVQGVFEVKIFSIRCIDGLR